MILIIISILLILIASTGDAIQDTISHHFDTSIFSNISKWKLLNKVSYNRKVKLYKWINPKYSWSNKWKNGKKEYGEAFPLSSTILVVFTDLWHTAQFIQLNALFLTILTFSYIDNNTTYKVIILILYKILYGLWFEYLYSHKFIKK
jgi:hypothetical protein